MAESLFDNLMPMEPIPTEETLSTRLAENELFNIQCIIFDVYGTLLVSDSGDIGGIKEGSEFILSAIQDAGIQMVADKEKVGERAKDLFLKAIQEDHISRKERGADFPEVNILEIWKNILADLEKENLIKIESSIDFESLSIKFEFLNNPTFPMPNMMQVLSKLNQAKFKLGIVSNAQFYTPMLLKYFLGVPDFMSDVSIPYFNPDYCIYSYEQGLAKPSITLFDKLTKNLKRDSIAPENCLFVGNDMLNDVYTAHKAGLKTALFAGDKRSLRKRKDHEKVNGLHPDLVITELSQILDLLGLTI